LLQPDLTNKSINLHISDVDHSILVDPELMEHVLINLFLNAIEALSGKKEGARISVTTSRHMKGNTCIHIADNGEGMDESTIEKIFIPFFTTRKHGSGIGLALTKQILQLHHADIRVKSEVAKGTEFIITMSNEE
jgi:signal transduction histidine kinase